MPDLTTLLFGWCLGIATVAVACDIRRKFASAQQRESLRQEAFERGRCGQ
jgi:hypothetical protein